MKAFGYIERVAKSDFFLAFTSCVRNVFWATFLYKTHGYGHGSYFEILHIRELSHNVLTQEYYDIMYDYYLANLNIDGSG